MADLKIIFTLYPELLLLFIGFLGLIIGSFLNVVIHRLPTMMMREWRQQCAELLNIPCDTQKTVFNLIVPRSRCPHCRHLIAAWENIPILSYLWQKGHCTACQQKIAWRYPIVELVSALLAIIVAWHFGLSWQLAAALIFTWALLAASVIDIDHQLLPDDIVLPLLWLGIVCNLFGLYTTLPESILGAIVGYLSLWSVYWLFKLVTGKEGMGYGDFKLLAAIGAWGGWQILPVVIFTSSIVGAVVGVSLMLFQNRDKNIPIPFGPYLACAGWIGLLWGNELMQAYLNWHIV